jgi:hypothetical protein
MKRIFSLLMGLLLIWTSYSCSITLNGATIPKELKTINVRYFENNAQLVVNNLSQAFTEALKDRIRSQTRLGIVQGEANASLEGSITGYSIAPVAIQATGDNTAPIAGASRLSITVKVKYTNEFDKKLNFEQDFTRFRDFRGDIASQEQALIQDINKQLTEDIFNRAFNNW